MLKEKETGKLVIRVRSVRKLGMPRAKTPYKVSHGLYVTLEYYLDEGVEGAE